MRIFDTHSHILDERLLDKRQDILLSIGKEMAGFMECATSRTDIPLVRALSDENERIYCALGIHPQEAQDFSYEDIDFIKQHILSAKRAAAIGEIGLDYHYDEPSKEKQKQAFDAQLSLAEELKKPIVIHMRDASEDTFDILNMHKGISGVFHCFSGSKESAKRALDMGFYISFSGTITFKNARKGLEVLEYVPLSRLLAETDCPYLSPEPLRGRTNEPKNVEHTIRFIAEKKGISFEEMCETNIRNYRKLFMIAEEI